MYLDKSVSFLKARKTREVELPEPFDCKVIIRELSVAQMAKLDKDLMKQLAMMIVDADGNQIYQTDEDLANLSEMPASISTLIFEAANEMNGVSAAAKDETVKN